MPPDEYTTVTISEETAEKLTELVVQQDLDSVADAVKYGPTVVRDPETFSNAELAQLLAKRLAD